MVSVFPTGVTIYEPEAAWNGYTVHSGGKLVDMNGNMVKDWEEIEPLGKVLPGGHILGGSEYGSQRHERCRELVQLSWNGEQEWKFTKTERFDLDDELVWSAKHHHDFQREGNPVGYYAPRREPLTEGGKTLLLASREVENPDIAPGKLLDDCILEISWDGDILWEWSSCKHFDQMELSEAAKNTLHRSATLPPDYDGLHNTTRIRPPYDWLHSNSASYLGPNKWYEEGDERFHPDNLIWDARDTNTIAIISKETKDFTWKVGPDYSGPELQELGQIIGQHHAHMIPKGLPGEGNILVFDNGGFAGYGEPNPGSPVGEYNGVRPYSRVIEFDPVTLTVQWEYSARTAGYDHHRHYRFYSPFLSSAQRLPNGNTLICEGNQGRLLEVTPSRDIVWEYIVPPSLNSRDGLGESYRAYRIPYSWIPQVDKPQEKPVTPPDLSNFRIESDF